jgi:DNA-binding MarR family transcriptional regulator/GNAT superfamily N-acetyltransferase
VSLSLLDPRIDAVRRFNRFYTRRIGVLNERLLHSRFTLTEVRVLFELAHRVNPTATELGKELGLDPGYLSRLLRRLEQRRLIQRRSSPEDGRQQLLQLTRQGRSTFDRLDARAQDEIGEMLQAVPGPEQERLVKAMQTIEGTLSSPTAVDPSPFLLRTHQPGDMGWVVERHGFLYAQEYGWDEQFEALVADIVARFLRRYDAQRERCWIAKRGGERVGSVFLVKKSATVGQLRLLLVEPSARGLGIGHRLVAECVRFARQVGYRKIVLWTNDVLHAARRIYQQAGFRMVKEEPHHSFGHDLVAQTWELELAGRERRE